MNILKSRKEQKDICVAIDCMGGDYGPPVTIRGAALAAKRMKNIHFLFFGKDDPIKAEIAKNPILEGRYKIIHTNDVVAGDEKPSTALRTGKKSSMRLAIDAVANHDADCIVSSGNTGALMAMAKLGLRCLPGIHRPAIASLLPTVRGQSLVLDLGANLVCDEHNYVEFSVLGSVYARAVLGVETPTVGLLNIGTEDTKGHEALQTTREMLSVLDIPGKFIGFVEGDGIGKGAADVIVTDGFTGNVALKTAEGIGALFRQTLRAYFGKSLFGKFAYLVAFRQFSAVRKRLDHRIYNGGLFLGLNGACIKSHGSADDYAFSHAVLAGAKMIDNKFNEIVAEEIHAIELQKIEASITVSDKRQSAEM